MNNIKTYYACDTCGMTCRSEECGIEVPVYEPFSGVRWEVEFGLQSHCCGASVRQRRTLRLTKRGKNNLLRIWNRRGNDEIINHIENVLQYIGEVNE